MPTRAETLHQHVTRLARTRRLILFAAWSPLLTLLVVVSVLLEGQGWWVVALLGSIPLLWGVDQLLVRFASTYRGLTLRLEADRRELDAITRAIANYYDDIPVRQPGQAFKRAYLQTPSPVSRFEERMVGGMRRERKEIWVLAFCRSGEVVRVTATIGSAFRCRPSDSPSSWVEHAHRLGVDELRFYHNHPVTGGSTVPSPADRRSYRAIQKALFGSGLQVRDFIVCWNRYGEWKLIEFDAQRHWIERVWEPFTESEPPADDRRESRKSEFRQASSR